MPKQRRLSRTEFPRRPTRRAAGDLLSLASSPLPSGSSARFTCVVPKKVARRAVDRNRLKRRCREAMRSLLDGAPPLAFVAYPKRTALDAPAAALKAELQRLLKALR